LVGLRSRRFRHARPHRQRAGSVPLPLNFAIFFLPQQNSKIDGERFPGGKWSNDKAKLGGVHQRKSSRKFRRIFQPVFRTFFYQENSCTICNIRYRGRIGGLKRESQFLLADIFMCEKRPKKKG
jgi:hypothetical protein